MDCLLPCVRFNLVTTESKHSTPTNLDLLVLHWIARRARSAIGCRVSDVAEFFRPLGGTVLHGIIHKLHLRYLLLYPDGRLDLRYGLEQLLEEDDKAALTVQTGERD